MDPDSPSDCNLSEAGLYLTFSNCTMSKAGDNYVIVEGSELEFQRGQMVPNGHVVLICASTFDSKSQNYFLIK